MSMIEAIVLAAGLSTRMGSDNKLLKDYQESTIVRHVVGQVSTAKVAKVIVVLGHQSEEVKSALKGLPVEFVYNAQHQSGQVWSIRAGLSLVSPQAQGIMIALGDMPLLSSRHINRLITHFTEVRPSNFNTIVRPVWGQRIGHPTIWDSSMRRRIYDHPDNETLKGLIKSHQLSYFPMEVDDEAYFTDVDTEEDYSKLAV